MLAFFMNLAPRFDNTKTIKLGGFKMKMNKNCNISIIIPCYNEEKVISKNLQKVYDEMKELKEKSKIDDFEIIAVDDGSKDKTAEKIEEVSKKIPEVKLLHYGQNKGKGGAVKEGFRAARFDYLLFMDADLATELYFIKPFITLRNTADIIIGDRTRFSKENSAGRPVLRKIMSKGCVKTVHLLLPELGAIHDFQCGFKMFSREAAELCLRKSTIDRFAFDTEFLYICKKNDMRIIESPVLWHEMNDSKVKARRDSSEFIKALLLMRKKRYEYKERMEDN